MKKLITLLLVLCGGISQASAADPSFLGNSAIQVNGTWYYAGQDIDWCSGGAFNNKNLGTISSFVIGGRSEAYDNANDWGSGTVTMHYQINSGTVKSINLDYKEFKNNNNIFESGGSSFTTTEIDLSGLACGIEHTISIWFQCGSSYDSNNTSNYVAKFTLSNSYTRDVTAGDFGTICLPFAATVAGATVFKIASKIVDGSSNLTGINLESVNELEAGKSYIFKATGTTLTATYSGTYTAASADYGMMGNLSSTPVTVAQGNYVVNSNKLRKVTGDAVTVGQYRGYVTLEGVGVASSARGENFISFVDDSTTGIETVNTQQFNADEAFDLQGRRVNVSSAAKGQKGIYILNGKKYIVK